MRLDCLEKRYGNASPAEGIVRIDSDLRIQAVG